MKKLIVITLAVLTFGISEVSAQDTQQFFKDANSFFGTYVSNGNVNYKAIHADQAQLDGLLSQAKEIKVSTSNANTYKAFWINAYNIAVIKGIIDNYPIKSPLDKKGFFDKTKYELGETSTTLNNIENKYLRAKFDDARFHFVLVCGAKGCPPLIGEAYTPSNLEKLLEKQTVKALNNDSFIKVSGKKVAFSEIFKWYKEDFVKGGQNEIDFLNKYRTEKVSSNSKVTYYSYDWRINSK